MSEYTKNTFNAERERNAKEAVVKKVMNEKRKEVERKERVARKSENRETTKDRFIESKENLKEKFEIFKQSVNNLFKSKRKSEDIVRSISKTEVDRDYGKSISTINITQKDGTAVSLSSSDPKMTASVNGDLVSYKGNITLPFNRRNEKTNKIRLNGIDNVSEAMKVTGSNGATIILTSNDPEMSLSINGKKVIEEGKLMSYDFQIEVVTARDIGIDAITKGAEQDIKNEVANHMSCTIEGSDNPKKAEPKDQGKTTQKQQELHVTKLLEGKVRSNSASSLDM